MTAAPVRAQVAYPDYTVQDITWTIATHHIAVTQGIMSPGDPSQPVSISGTADAEFVSGTRVRLTDGFHAGDFTGAGQFRARIDESLGTASDLVLVAPHPDSYVIDNVVHVPKWEKLELGMRLPEEYQNAIDSFFTHYYSNGDSAFATPGAVDPAHDLNPYADDSLLLVITLTSPTNVQHMKWGFYMTEAMWLNAADSAELVEDHTDPLHPYNIRFRTALEEEGEWQFSISIKAPHTNTSGNAALGSLLYADNSLVCDAPLVDNKGYLQVNPNNHRILQFEDGTPFFALGTNVGTGRITTTGAPDFGVCQRDIVYLKKSMEQLHSAGGNFMRMFLGLRDFAPEHVNLGVYDAYYAVDPCDSASNMPNTWGNCQFQCWDFDGMLDHARANNIYLQLALDPYPPIGAYENYGWGNHAYMIQFIEPYPWETPLNKYNLKRFFYNNGDPATANEAGEVFYYWKRKYKYMMARWGYSVDIAALEPFNEIDQMLSYQTDTIDLICDENDGPWSADPLLPGIISNWLTDIAHYVRDPVDPNDPIGSPLGEAKKLLALSYTDVRPGTDLVHYGPLRNPALDIVDVHQYLYEGDDRLSNAFDADQVYRDNLTDLLSLAKRPFQNGESNYAAGFDLDNNPNTGYNGKEYGDMFKIYTNYDVAFHNELWSGVFGGNMSTGTTWGWERVFWWPRALPRPPNESFSQNPWQTVHSDTLGAVNKLNPDGDSVHVRNRTIFHNFKPLSDLLSNANWQSLGFFNGDYNSHKVFDDVNKIESYYLVNADSNLAIGWVHNVNAYWENHYYIKNTSTFQNFFGCSPPGAQQLTLPGFRPGTDFYITYFPTRMNDTIHPPDDIDTSGTGFVGLDLNAVPLGDTAYKYLDTLHVDYAFIVSASGHVKNALFPAIASHTQAGTEWDFDLYPNPARNDVLLRLPDESPKNIGLYDLSGRCIAYRPDAIGVLQSLSVGSLSSGPYCVRVSNSTTSHTKILIIH